MPRHPNTPDVFWSRAAKTESCWLWTGQINKSRFGYGVIRWHGATKRAHRLAWELVFGPIPDGLEVLHSCDNPPCVNPNHLRLGTHRDNIADMMIKGRSRKGSRNGDAKLTEDQVRSIRIEYGQMTGKRLVTLAKKYGVGKSAISLIIRRETWQHC